MEKSYRCSTRDGVRLASGHCRCSMDIVTSSVAVATGQAAVRAAVVGLRPSLAHRASLAKVVRRGRRTDGQLTPARQARRGSICANNRWICHSEPPPVHLAGGSVWLASRGRHAMFILPLSPPLPDAERRAEAGKGGGNAEDSRIASRQTDSLAVRRTQGSGGQGKASCQGERMGTTQLCRVVHGWFTTSHNPRLHITAPRSQRTIAGLGQHRIMPRGWTLLATIGRPVTMV